MALTLVGVTPGAFNIDSDCNCVVNSSSAAMTTYNVSFRSRDDREKVQLLCALQRRELWSERATSTNCTRDYKSTVKSKGSRVYEDGKMIESMMEGAGAELQRVVAVKSWKKCAVALQQ
jgi:hypothetical protein